VPTLHKNGMFLQCCILRYSKPVELFFCKVSCPFCTVQQVITAYTRV